MISSNKEDGTLSDRDYGYNIYNLFIWKDGLTKMANAAGYECLSECNPNIGYTNSIILCFAFFISRVISPIRQTVSVLTKIH